MLASLARRQFGHAVVIQAPPLAAFGLSVRSVDSEALPGREGPVFDPVRGLLAVIDGRIDDRLSLCDSLGCPGEVSDTELVIRGYDRWGTSLADTLCGDFALAVWDIKQRTLYAARDPFGVKPLYFSTTPERVLLSNDVEPLLAHVDRRAIDPQVVLDYLTTSFGHYRRTFFRGISRLQAGHYLLVTETSCRQVRYFFPPENETQLGSAQDYQQEFKRLLRQSVHDRLRSPHPVVAHLSGGLDSTSIVLLADDIYKTGEAGLPPLHTASAIFPGLDCDESAVIAATSARVAFPSERWVGYDAKWEHLDNPTLAWPGSPAPISGGSTGDLAIAKRLGARVILAGTGGDEISYGGGVFRDLAAHGRWLTLWRETMGSDRFTWPFRWMFLKDSAIGLVPEPVRRLRRRFLPTRAGDPPGWLGPNLREIWPGDIDELNDGNVRWKSWVQRGVWKALVTATTSVPMDYRHHYGAEAGIEMRFPFLDRRLVSFVLAIPWQQRLPGGFMRLLQWKAMEDRLPAGIFSRASVVTSESARIQEGRRAYDRYREILGSRNWASREFVKQTHARALLASAANSTSVAPREKPDSRSWQAIQRIATLETWLRAVFGYIPQPEE